MFFDGIVLFYFLTTCNIKLFIQEIKRHLVLNPIDAYVTIHGSILGKKNQTAYLLFDLVTYRVLQKSPFLPFIIFSGKYFISCIKSGIHWLIRVSIHEISITHSHTLISSYKLLW